MATKAECLRLARKAIHRKAEIRENKAAPTHEQRQARRARMAEIKAEQEAITAGLKSLKDHAEKLLTAAKFVCDVNGDSPSIEQLMPAVERSQRAFDLLESKRQLQVEFEKLRSGLHQYRFDVATIHAGPFPHYSIECSSDTLAELEDKLRLKLEKLNGFEVASITGE